MSNDKLKTIELYIARNNDMKLDSNKLILDHINKLGYNYINIDSEINKYLKFKYENNIEKFLNISFYDYKIEYSKTFEFEKLRKQICDIMSRSITLSKFIGTYNIKSFYETCTLEELYFLGY